MNTAVPSPSDAVRPSMREIVGRGYAVETEAGECVFEQFAEAFRKGQRVEGQLDSRPEQHRQELMEGPHHA